MASARAVTIKDLALACGCSATAVSLALRGVGKLSPQLRERVRGKARDLGYRRDSSAVLLRSRGGGGARPQGLPIVFLERKGADPALPAMLVQGLGQAAQAWGYRMERRAYETREELAALFQELSYRGVDLLLVGNIGNDDEAPDLDWGSFAVLAILRFARSYPFHTLRYNQFLAIRTCFRHALAQGYRRIGLVLLRHEVEMLDDSTRQAASLQMADEFRGQVADIPVLTYAERPDPAKLEAWRRAYRPEVVLGFNEGVYYALRGLGLRIPEDLGYIDLHGGRKPMKDGLVLCGAHVDREEFANLAVGLAESLLRQNRRGRLGLITETIVIPQFAPGPSLPPVSAGVGI